MRILPRMDGEVRCIVPRERHNTQDTGTPHTALSAVGGMDAWFPRGYASSAM